MNKPMHSFLPAAVACGLALLLSPGPLRAAGCPIDGPNAVAANQSFTLCGISGGGYTYEWQGQGLTTSSASRCVTVGGRIAGSYDYQLIVRRFGVELERCNHTVTVGGGGGYGSPACAIDGPTVVRQGMNVQLCAPSSSDAIYRWDGPNDFTATSRCVVVHVPGTYYLTVRSRSTGAEDQCSHRLSSAETGNEGCTISGPASIVRGNTVELCSQSFTNSTYSWTGPGAMRSSQRCIRVTAPGVYRLAIRSLSSGVVRECSFTLDDAGGGGYNDDDPDDGDMETSDNCPRAVPFWQQQCRRTASGRPINPNDFDLEDLRVIARRIDERSTYFNWTDDVNGLCAALNPAAPLTHRKQAIRHLVALEANVAAGELGVTTRGGDGISLDPATSIKVPSANTIGELIALSERMLARGRGSFSTLSQRLNAVNRGRGIGPVCQ
ncbi:MAG: hypothetical protein ABIS67_13545 [Candidatus Eisenbacteria bacterium]